MMKAEIRRPKAEDDMDARSFSLRPRCSPALRSPRSAFHFRLSIRIPFSS